MKFSYLETIQSYNMNNLIGFMVSDGYSLLQSSKGILAGTVEILHLDLKVGGG